MKTLNEVKAEVQRLHDLAWQGHSFRVKKYVNQHREMYQLQLFMELNPTREFIERMLHDTEREIETLNKGFASWRIYDKSDSTTPAHTRFRKEVGLPLLEMRAKRLKWILE